MKRIFLLMLLVNLLVLSSCKGTESDDIQGDFSESTSTIVEEESTQVSSSSEIESPYKKGSIEDRVNYDLVNNSWTIEIEGFGDEVGTVEFKDGEVVFEIGDEIDEYSYEITSVEELDNGNKRVHMALDSTIVTMIQDATGLFGRGDGDVRPIVADFSIERLD